MTKPREFWIVDTWNPIVATRQTYDNKPADYSISSNDDVFHVIEKSAYDELENKYAELRAEYLELLDNSDSGI
jgi:hypothetical protein